MSYTDKLDLVIPATYEQVVLFNRHCLRTYLDVIDTVSLDTIYCVSPNVVGEPSAEEYDQETPYNLVAIYSRVHDTDEDVYLQISEHQFGKAVLLGPFPKLTYLTLCAELHFCLVSNEALRYKYIDSIDRDKYITDKVVYNIMLGT